MSAIVVPASAPAPVPALTGGDRCDRCGAGAKVRAVLASGAELLLCGHHARVHAVRLREMAAELYGDGPLSVVEAASSAPERELPASCPDE